MGRKSTKNQQPKKREAKNKVQKSKPEKDLLSTESTHPIDESHTLNKKRTKLRTVLNWLGRAALTLLGFTGFTIFNPLPGIEFTLKSTTDQNWLAVEIRNTGWVAIKKIRPVLYVYSMHTTLGDSVHTNLVSTNINQPIPSKLSRNQKYTIDYSMNESFFGYRDRPQYTQPAFMALEVTYDFLFLTLDDVFFVECRPDYHGDYTWLETQDQGWFEAMKADTTASLDAIPSIRRAKEDPRFKNMPPSSIPFPALPKDD